ncbi:MAG: DUF4350 domain-containing protein [Gammaproteobacteria bacterium]|nr:DUF4350 domain-containing protein [Gammaproteobacteria bacterium]MBU1723206.1 DUF4350 domain-containing protein [Gammaproteobacteria bacterium]MBU2007231.1 DUF4350 domain-containing protein [Gammaproteobacteria bacterium]
MTRQQILIGLFALLVAIAGVYWFVNTFQLKEVDEHVGFRGEAKTNQLFAARLFLKRMGVPAERKDTLVTLPDTDTVLLINTQRYTLSRQKIDEILAWVKRGGHLITRARSNGSATIFDDGDDSEETEETEDDSATERDFLQQALGITVGKHIIPDDDDLPLDAELTGMPDELGVDPDFFNALESSNENARVLQYKDATWLLEQPWGDGMVTLAANLDFIENHALQDYDHAEFFWYMLHSQHDEPRSVWLLHMDDMPPLWKLIWEHAWALVLTLAMLVPLTILALSPRFGPLIPKPEPGRRRILEHIHASGRFMWKRHSKHGDAHYRDFAASVEHINPSTRKQHDDKQPDA